MVDIVYSEAGIPRPDHPLDQWGGAKWFLPAVGVLVLVGIFYVGHALIQDQAVAKTVPRILLGIALLIALGFEFINGFHDTANAVATVIYTRSMPAEFAVMWSGAFNFLGVLTSSGAVAFGILSLLPVELILQVGSSSGFAMVFALLVAAILWNLGSGLTKTVALEAAIDGVTVNAIAPGYVWTPLVERQIPDTMKTRGMTEEQVKHDVLLAAQPTKEFVTVDELAALTLFLCSDSANQITDTTLPMDGGWTAQ
jgi:hypothetical protein